MSNPVVENMRSDGIEVAEPASRESQSPPAVNPPEYLTQLTIAHHLSAQPDLRCLSSTNGIFGTKSEPDGGFL
ncbi:hypothetical protein DPMN_074283 [Dreissena polymorpha]|uniref:Uncharacterized protein n=1 Tax=Dreissena polymorpha TaxID=45954 RepID=A0A9D3YF15_DREPO|nr:hypothetical protein DPMN_074283 [Dreissena polymorpha]